MNNSWAIRRLVSHIKEEWRRGESPDAEAALAAHPQLRRWKSIVLDLAFEEYHLRTGEGQDLGPGEFCKRFPEHQRSLLHRIEIEQYLRREEEQHAICWPQEGAEFLGYRLVEQLGKGAVGRVFLAQQIELRDRPVVVKITPRGQREAHTLALLNHPHIVPIYRYDEDPQTGLAAICMPYLGRLTMEDLLIAGQDGLERDFTSLLDELKRRYPSDFTSLTGEHRRGVSRTEGMLEIGRKIAEALVHTHHRGVLHLDLKPSNVLLLDDGRPMLLDFNLSIDGAIGASVIGGTLPYMSPEQLQEAVLGRSYSSRPVDGRSDVFSLGVMLYELLSGRHPFGEIPRTRDSREAAKELLRRHERGPGPWPANMQVDWEVMRFLDACLAFHPDQRPQSAGEAAAALGRFLSSRFRIRRWVRRRRKTVVAIGAISLAALLSVATAAVLAPPESERLLRTGQAHLERQEWKLAEAALRESLNADDGSPLAWELLGQSQLKQARHRDAFASLEKAYQLSGEPRLLESLGDCKFAEKEYALAAGWYERAITEYVSSGTLPTKLGESLAKTDQFEAAHSRFSEAAEVSPGSRETRRSRLRAAINASLTGNQPTSDTALTDALAICDDALSDNQALYEAAIVFAHAASPEEYEAHAQNCLQTIRRRGFDMEKLRRGASFRAFSEKNWFLDLFAEPDIAVGATP
jgi:eukaryotic-like serine/threonine-protein kinase